MLIRSKESTKCCGIPHNRSKDGTSLPQLTLTYMPCKKEENQPNTVLFTPSPQNQSRRLPWSTVSMAESSSRTIMDVLPLFHSNQKLSNAIFITNPGLNLDLRNLDIHLTQDPLKLLHNHRLHYLC